MKDKIIEKIQEVCPELMKLEFGCKLLDETHQSFGQSDPITCLIADEWANEEDEKHYIDHFREHSNRYTNSEIRKRFKILGKEPQLNHLYRAIPKQKNDKDFFFSIDTDGAIWYNEEIAYNKEGNELLYDLTKSVSENLDNKELANFISSILFD